MTGSVILEEAELYRLEAEMKYLLIQRDAADVRIAEITRVIVTSGEARLRASRETTESEN